MGAVGADVEAEPVVWAIGDIHGRKKTLDALLARLDFEEDRDHLWLVGDLVNRGPDSLGVLRWARRRHEALGERFACVLGNHDLHLLAAWRGRRKVGGELAPVLAADDAGELLGWLRRRPLVARGFGHLMVHAGLWPRWRADDAEGWARRVEKHLRRRDGLLDGGEPARVGSEKSPGEPAMLRDALYAFTVLRCLSAEGPTDFKGPPEEAPDGDVPWFDAPGRASRDVTVVCGHWAALGLRLMDGVLALDSGAAWGGPLTACRLGDRHVVQQENLDE